MVLELSTLSLRPCRIASLQVEQLTEAGPSPSFQNQPPPPPAARFRLLLPGGNHVLNQLLHLADPDNLYYLKYYNIVYVFVPNEKSQ